MKTKNKWIVAAAALVILVLSPVAPVLASASETVYWSLGDSG